MTLNPQTGMPQLPGGHYWHVKFTDEAYLYPGIVVQIRRRYAIRPFWTVVAEAETRIVSIVDKPTGGWKKVYIDPERVPEVILELADKALKKKEKYFNEKIYWAKINAAETKYSGSYPPKKLEK